MHIGSAGAIQPHIKLRDIVLGQGACTDSRWASQYHLAGDFAPICSFRMLKTAVELAEEMGLPYHVGNLLSSDRFYGDDADLPERLQAETGWQKMGVMAFEQAHRVIDVVHKGKFVEEEMTDEEKEKEKEKHPAMQYENSEIHKAFRNFHTFI